MPALPFKLNQDRRHHIPEQTRKVTNWRDYDESLRRRSSVTVWFSDEAVEAWEAERRTSRGGQPEYSDLAILTALTFKAVFRLAYRQTEGLIGSVIGLLGLDLATADHTTLCRRAETLEVPRPKPRGAGAGDDAGGGAEPMHLLVDSTGLKLYGAGERLAEEHGARGRGPGRLRHAGRRVRPGRCLRRRGRAPPRGGGRRPAARDGGAERHGRDRADAAGPPPPTHRRGGAHGMAEGDGLQRPRPGRGGHLSVQARDRGRAARAHRPAPRDRGQRRRPRAQPHAGAGTPGVRPHRMTPGRGRGRCVRYPDPCNTVARAPQIGRSC